MKASNFYENNIVGVALKPGNVAATAVDGETISEPWKKGRQISFLLQAAAMTTNDALTITVQGLKRSDGTTWEALKDLNANDLTFPTAKTADTKALENGVLIGSLPMAKLDADTYKAIRISAVNGAAHNVVCSALYVISDLYAYPSGMVDDLIAEVAPYAGTA
jgi:hypothetical protein